MILSHAFQIPFQDKRLYAESTLGANGHLLMLHGGGKDRTVFYKYRALLDALGFGTTIFDFLGHGETGGDMHDSSLLSRTMQAKAVIDYLEPEVTGCIGVSMGAYNALQLSREVLFRSLILMVPGVYTPTAYNINFGPDFSNIIRQPRSWAQTDAWRLAAEFSGRLLVIAAENDSVIPADIPERLVSSTVNAAARERITIPGADHNTIWQSLMLSPEQYEKVCLAFEKCLSGQAG